MALTIYVAPDDAQGVVLARNEYGNFDVEASTLGLAPGVWPDTLGAVADGERLWLVRGDVRKYAADPTVVTYRSHMGSVHLLVWND
jgi:hypothetical protein